MVVIVAAAGGNSGVVGQGEREDYEKKCYRPQDITHSDGIPLY